MTLQDGLFVLIGFLLGIFVSSLYFRHDVKKHRKEVDEKLKFLDENPAPLKGAKYEERKN